jgi:hypothetical protein
MSFMKESRRQQSLGELNRLVAELDAWKKRRIDADTNNLGNYRGRYDSQLHQITAEILDAAKAVCDLIKADLTGKTYADVCREFNLHDQRIFWIRYVWDYFRNKLDQRDDPYLRPALEAADEVLWSCYRPYFQDRKLTGPPPPIAGIANDYTASALRRQSGHVLEGRVDAGKGPLKDYFKTLPVGILRLPPTVVSAPWTLALIAHECGHFLQDSVEDGAPAGGLFANRVEAAVRHAGGGETEVKLWSKWAPEIFADLVAVMALGPWAIWALANWTLSTADPLARQSAYPSPLVRLYLIGQMAKGLDGVELILQSLGIVESAAVTAESQIDLKIAAEVAKLAGQPFGSSTVPLAIHFDFRPDDYREDSVDEERRSEIEQWTDCLLGVSDRQAVENLRAARLVAAGATRAHFRLSTTEDADFESRAASLAKRTREMLAACHEEGKRAAPPSFSQASTGGLAAALVQANPEELLEL